MTRIMRVSAGVAPAFRFGRIAEPAIIACCFLAMAGTAEALKVARVKEQAKVALPGADMIDHRGRRTAGNTHAIVLQVFRT